MKKFIYRIIRYINRYTTITPEFQKKISRADFIEWAKQYLDYPYILWADGWSKETGIDCSHLISRTLIDTGCMDPYFYRTAHYLKNLTTKNRSESVAKAWDLLFLYDDTGNIGHVAIIIEDKWDKNFQILDASGPSTGIWSTKIRDITISREKYYIGTPIFLY